MEELMLCKFSIFFIMKYLGTQLEIFEKVKKLGAYPVFKVAN